MTAPSRSGGPDASASTSAARQQQLLQALTTEHFTLQTARSATIADSNGRASDRETRVPQRALGDVGDV